MNRAHASRLSFDQLVHGVSVRRLARRLRVSERTAADWVRGRRPVPWWVVELLSLQDWMRWDIDRQVGVSLAARSLPFGTGQALRRSITELVFESLDRASEQGLELGHSTDFPRALGALVLRHTLEAQRPAGVPPGGG